MKFLRVLVYLALFCVNVRIHAAQKSQDKEKPRDLPACWGKSTPCPVQAIDSGRVVEAPGLKIALSQGSLVEGLESSTIQLVSGSFYIETSKPVVFKTPYARFYCEAECKALVDRIETQVTLQNLNGRWLIRRAGEEQEYALAAGLQTMIGEVEQQGQAQMEFPQSLPWLPTVKKWAALYPGSPKELKVEIADFRPVWKGAVEAASRLHGDTAKRAIAAAQSEQAEERARQRARAAEDESLRSLFREKNNLNP